MKKPSKTKSVYSPQQWIDGLFDKLSHGIHCQSLGKDIAFEKTYALTKKILADTKKRNGIVWWAGNGGSESIGAHLSQDLINKLGIRSVHLGSAPLLTCMANDFGYENTYSRPLETLIKKGDLLIAISSSGNSKNILKSVEVAKKRGAKVITLSSFNKLNPLFKMKVDLGFYLASDLYGHAEVGHLLLLHALFECIYLESIKG